MRIGRLRPRSMEPLAAFGAYSPREARGPWGDQKKTKKKKTLVCDWFSLDRRYGLCKTSEASEGPAGDGKDM